MCFNDSFLIIILRPIFIDGGTIACNITNAIAYFIAKDNLPLLTVENEGFKHFMKTVAPLYNIPSRKTITRLLDAKYEVLKQKFINNIQQASSFTLTCDIWTDISNKSYLGVTIHYLKTEVTLTKGVIGVIPLEQNHTSEYIKDELLSVLQNFKINQSDITAVVTDSASNMVNAINDIFGARKHIPCMAHILAHVVPDSLKRSYPIEDIIKKVKSIVTLVRRSVVATDELVRLQKRDGKTDGTILKFKQDVPTRWNSTFYMIERFLQLRVYIYPVILKCPTSPEMITHEEFDILQDIVKILQPVELVTKEIGGDLYPTCSIMIPIIRCMTKTINDYIPITNNGASLKQNILLEIERRFCDIERRQILAISTILDPRFKKIHFQRLMHVSSAIGYINTLMQRIADDNTNLVNNTSGILFDVENKENIWNLHDNLVASSNTPRDEPGGINVELRQYLNQSVISRHDDPLKYWQILKNAYPTLFKIAKQYLAVVATSVPSERMFSKAGLIKTDIRNRLSPTRLNILLFLQSLDCEYWKFT